MRLVIIAIALVLPACPSTQKKGECEDYKPLDICRIGWRMECETTEDGCEVCSCVPMREEHGPVFPD